MKTVLDASALLAFLQHEPGFEIVDRVLDEATISTVNWCEVVQKALARDVDVTRMTQLLKGLNLAIESFTEAQAETTAQLWPQTRDIGLSLADRACLALALDKSLPVLTADRAWRQLKLNLDIQVVR